MLSPAFRNNNLAVDSTLAATFAINEVLLHLPDSSAVSSLSVDGNITSVALYGRTIVVTSTVGTSIFSNATRKLLFFFAVQRTGKSEGDDYHQGTALLNQSKLCVGHSDGSIHFFAVDQGRYTYSSSIPRDERASVECLATVPRSDGDWLIAGHSDGTVCVWKPVGQGLSQPLML
jgi:WD40 repeat protein